MFSKDNLGPRLTRGNLQTDSFTVGQHPVFLVIGLGNPGKEYSKNRHNVGFMMLDQLSEKFNSTWTGDSKKSADSTQFDNGSAKLILVKPTTMMNLSGDSVQSFKNFFKLSNQQIIVISDDIDMDFGKIRVRQSGGSGGHNGLSDISKKIGDDYWRIRIGCKNEVRDKIDAADFVLSNFTSEEISDLEKLAFKEIGSQIAAITSGHGKDDSILYRLSLA